MKSLFDIARVRVDEIDDHYTDYLALHSFENWDGGGGFRLINSRLEFSDHQQLIQLSIYSPIGYMQYSLGSESPIPGPSRGQVAWFY